MYRICIMVLCLTKVLRQQIFAILIINSYPFHQSSPFWWFCWNVASDILQTHHHISDTAILHTLCVCVACVSDVHCTIWTADQQIVQMSVSFVTHSVDCHFVWLLTRCAVVSLLSVYRLFSVFLYQWCMGIWLGQAWERVGLSWRRNNIECWSIIWYDMLMFDIWYPYCRWHLQETVIDRRWRRVAVNT